MGHICSMFHYHFMHILINIISRMINEMITEDKPCEIDDVKF